jgi:CheY-like chemotaxis protein
MKGRIRGENYKILFVDDEERFRRTTARWLRKEFNVVVDVVESGRAAIQAAGQNASYDFIFLDLMMPGLDGVRTYRELRRLNVTARVVMMSAYSSSELWREAEELGLQPLPKPLKEESLIEIFDSRRGE